jgi:hypothetical protein
MSRRLEGILKENDGFGNTCEGYIKLVKAVEDDEMIVIE